MKTIFHQGAVEKVQSLVTQAGRAAQVVGTCLAPGEEGGDQAPGGRPAGRGARPGGRRRLGRFHPLASYGPSPERRRGARGKGTAGRAILKISPGGGIAQLSGRF